MNRSGARLSDIANRTGYSKNTVSLALRDSPRIPEATRDIIRQAANALNYRPNHAAKSLTSRQTKTIGLLLADIATAQEITGRLGRLDRIDLILPEGDDAARQRLEAMLPAGAAVVEVAARAGTVAEIVAEPRQPVQFGDVLLLLRPEELEACNSG